MYRSSDVQLRQLEMVSRQGYVSESSWETEDHVMVARRGEESFSFIVVGPFDITFSAAMTFSLYLNAISLSSRVATSFCS